MTLSQVEALHEAIKVNGFRLSAKPYSGHAYRPSFYTSHRFYALRGPGLTSETEMEFFYGGGIKLPTPGWGDDSLTYLYRVNATENLELSEISVVEYTNMALKFYDRRPGIRNVVDWISEQWRFRLDKEVLSCFESRARTPQFIKTLQDGAFEVQAHFLDCEKLELFSEKIVVERNGVFRSSPGNEIVLLCRGTWIAE